MNAPDLNGVASLIKTLHNDPDYVTMFTWNGIVRTFYELVDQDVPFPYVVITHMMGGLLNQTKQHDADLTFRVAVKTNDMQQALSGRNVIAAALIGKTPIVTGLTGVRPQTTIEEVIPVLNITFVENMSVIQAGADYCIRLNIDS